MAKFKVGNRVKILIDGTYGTVDVVLDGESCGVIKSGEKIGRYYPFCYLELVEPEKEFSIHGKILSYGEHYYIRREDNSFRELGKLNTYKNDGFQAIMTFTPVENQLHLPLSHIHRLYTRKEMAEQITKDRIKKAFERPMVEEAFDMSKAIKTIGENLFKPIPVMKGTLELVEEIMNYGKLKNRIPDRVVFDESKGKVTVLISKMNDGEAPYRAYTSKVNVEGGDKFDAQFGFLLSYYKYLIRSLSGDVQKEMLDRIFKLVPSKRYAYLLGVVENEVLKIECVKSYKDWQDIYMAITETPKTSLNVYNYTWDYLEWQEMLRVHELETKREKQREVQKEIKKHQKAIEELKKKEV